MLSRLAPAALVVALVAALATGCFAQPEPEPTPVFETEEEAFAAAEETYRAYVDALNQVDLSDPETFEGVYAWTTGEANANERETLTQMHADGWTVSGETRMERFYPLEADLDAVSVSAKVCSNVADVTVVDSSGSSVVSSERPDMYTIDVQFIESEDTATGLAISSSNAVEDPVCTT